MRTRGYWLEQLLHVSFIVFSMFQYRLIEWWLLVTCQICFRKDMFWWWVYVIWSHFLLAIDLLWIINCIAMTIIAFILDWRIPWLNQINVLKGWSTFGRALLGILFLGIWWTHKCTLWVIVWILSVLMNQFFLLRGQDMRWCCRFLKVHDFTACLVDVCILDDELFMP